MARLSLRREVLQYTRKRKWRQGDWLFGYLAAQQRGVRSRFSTAQELGCDAEMLGRHLINMPRFKDDNRPM